ncbi:MAG: class I SAM-dependent methyltransferase [Actinomycetota bacterium]
MGDDLDFLRLGPDDDAAAALAAIDPDGGPVAILADVRDATDPVEVARRLGRALWGASEVLSRDGVGLAVLVAEGVDVEAVLGGLGRAVLPVTAHHDEQVVQGWLTGQHVAGPVRSRPIAGSRSTGGSARLHDYVLEHASAAGEPIAAALAAETKERFGALGGMNIGEDQGRFLQLLTEISGARHVVEVGTFTGMSALWIARGLPADGRLVCCDVSEDFTSVGRPFWEQAGVADRIEVRIGPAADTLRALPAEPHVDLAFIDADKTGYATYVEELLPRLAPGGTIAIDNVLWGGTVIDPSVTDPDTDAIRRLNDELAGRDDLDVLMLTIGDGVTLVRRRSAG